MHHGCHNSTFFNIILQTQKIDSATIIVLYQNQLDMRQLQIVISVFGKQDNLACSKSTFNHNVIKTNGLLPVVEDASRQLTAPHVRSRFKSRFWLFFTFHVFSSASFLVLHVSHFVRNNSISLVIFCHQLQLWHTILTICHQSYKNYIHLINEIKTL